MRKRKRLQRKRRRALAQAFKAQEAIQSKPAQASDYLYYLDDYHKKHPDMQAVLLPRVSTPSQKYKGNGDTQEKLLRQKCKALNIPVVGCFSETKSGKILNEKRTELIKAIRKAQKRNAVILAIAANRFLRNENFTTTQPDLLPTDTDFIQLEEMAQGVPLVTLLPPDTSPKEVMSYFAKQGQKAKDNKGGRQEAKRPGYKKNRKRNNQPQARQLYKEGKTISEIAKQLRRAWSTIADWIK